MERNEEMTNINELDDKQLKELYSCVRTPEVSDEVFKRIAEHCPITSTNRKLEEIKQLAKGTYSFDRFCYRTPYSCMVNGKRVWYHSLNEMYYRLTGDDKYYKEEYNTWIEHEWWLGRSRPTPYKKWLEDRGITL